MVAINPNIAQRRAADPASSVWVSASAGSGKTKVLTDRVLALLLTGSSPERLLCLTFTKAAAAEMAGRVNKRLALWTRADDPVLEAQIADLLDRPARRDEVTRARRLFALVLDAPGGLKIQTIHGFCQSILGRFPLEARVPPRFDVLDDRDAADLMRDARNQVLQRADQDFLLSVAIAAVSRRVQEDRFDELLKAMAGERLRLQRFVGRTPEDLEAAIDRLYGLLDAEKGLSAESVIDIGCKSGSPTGPDDDSLGTAIGAMDAVGLGKRGAEAMAVMADFLSASHPARVKMFSEYQSVFVKKDGDPVSLKWQFGQSFLDAAPHIIPLLEAEQERILRLDEQAGRQATAASSEALIRLGAEIVASYETAKQVRGVLDYDDLIIQTRELLAREATGWVMFKLDGGLDHILVDEAQDTSPEQWDIIRALAEEFFAGDGQVEESLRTLFVVGDVKQSIYSFQRADPEAFLRMRAFFQDRAALSQKPFVEVPMTVSFRSTNAVLAAVDAAFMSEQAKQGVAAPDERIEHFAHRDQAPGLVELWPLVLKADAPDTDLWDAAGRDNRTNTDDQAVLPSPYRRLARGVAKRVAEWIGKKPLPSRNGALASAGDILILVRGRTASLVESLMVALKEQGVEVAGLDRMRLSNELSVMDIMALARFALLPEDDLILATLLRGPFVALSEDALFSLAYDRGAASLWSRLRDAEYGPVTDWLSRRIAQADQKPAFEFFTDLLMDICPRRSALDGGKLTGREALIAQLGIESEDPVDEFLTLALSFERNQTVSLQGFVKWFDGGEAEVKRDTDTGVQDELRIMTVHGAKGLQAPLVILADTGRRPNENASSPMIHWLPDSANPTHMAQSSSEIPVWAPTKSVNETLSAKARLEKQRRDEEEHRRLLYVAMTRAEDELYLCGVQNDKSPPEGSWWRLVHAGLSLLPNTETIPFDGGEGWDGEALRLSDQATASVLETINTEGSDVPAELIEDTTAPEWARRRPAPEPSPPRPVAPSRPASEDLEAEDPPVFSPFSGGGARFKRGLLIHRLLQTLPDVPEEARADRAKAFLQRPGVGISAAEVEAITAETLAVMQVPGFAALFGPGSRAEVPLTGIVSRKNGPEVISGQVDRLIITEKEVLVVDYKTLRPSPATAEETPLAYIRQMAAYRALLTQIFPEKPVRCAILWTDQARLLPLDTGLLETEI